MHPKFAWQRQTFSDYCCWVPNEHLLTNPHDTDGIPPPSKGDKKSGVELTCWLSFWFGVSVIEAGYFWGGRESINKTWNSHVKCSALNTLKAEVVLGKTCFILVFFAQPIRNHYCCKDKHKTTCKLDESNHVLLHQDSYERYWCRKK